MHARLRLLRRGGRGEGSAPSGEAGEATGQGSGAAGVCALDEDEPRRVAEAARRLGLRHVVITSVTRDDLPDGGAAQFAAAVAAVRAATPEATVEVLIPDLGGDEAALRAVLAARPDVLNHNLETVPRLYPQVRPQARYERSLELLARAAAWARSPSPRARRIARTRRARRRSVRPPARQDRPHGGPRRDRGGGRRSARRRRRRPAWTP